MIFRGGDLEIWRMTLKNNRAPLLCYFKLCASFRSHLVNSNFNYSPETPNLGQIRRFLEACDLEIWQMTLQNNRAPLLCYFKLSTSFRSHWWIQTWVTVRKRTPNLGQIRRFLEACDLEIWQMTLQNNGHLFYATSSFLHHFVAIGEFKLELQSGNAQSGSNLTIFRAVRRWNLTDDLAKQ